MIKTLQTKLVLILIAVFLMVISINMILTNRLFQEEYTQAIEAEAFAIGEGLAGQAERLLAYGLPLEDLIGFEEFCEDVVRKYPRIAFAEVVDVNGKIMFHSDGKQRRRAVDEPALFRAVASGTKKIVDFKTEGKSIYGFVVPVANSSGRHVGAVILGYPEEVIARKVADLTSQSFFLAFLLFGLAIALIAVVFSVWVTKPLSKLQRAIDEIVASGTESISPVDIDANDEIGRLAKSFNSMAGELRTTTVSKDRLEETLQQLKLVQAHLIQQEKMAGIGQLAAGVAHEINNPMAFIISNLESLDQYTSRIIQILTLQEKALAAHDKTERDREVAELNEAKRALKIDYVLADTRELIKETLDGAARVKKIVQDLRGFVRPEYESKLANINDGIESAVNILRNEILYRGASVSKELGDIPPIMCNPGQLNQAFMNILVNAAQAIETAGNIHIKTWADTKNVFISVADTGKGIPPEIMNRIFEPFFTTKDIGQGKGLGLSVSYDIVRRHGGQISVESRDGEGTTVTVALPINNEEMQNDF